MMQAQQAQQEQATQSVNPQALLEGLTDEQLAVVQEHPEMLENVMSGA